MEAARATATEIVDATGAHRGVGLALDVPDRGRVILTCHHVIAPMSRDEIRVKYHGGRVERATIDDGATRADRDVAVLTAADPPATQNPRLHAPSPATVAGPLDGQALSPGAGTGIVGASVVGGDFDRVINVPYEPGRYELPEAYLLRLDDSREGVSGSPLYCESGVIGLVHAARDQSAGAARVGYASPLTAWAEGLPGLDQLMEPFVTQNLRDHASIYWATVASSHPELRVQGRRTDYLERPEDTDARRAFERGALCLVGRHNTGKSRLISRLLQDDPHAVVVFPHRRGAPDLAKESDLRDRHVILVFENIHVAAAAWRPLEWYDKFSAVVRHTTLVVTTWNADWWERVSAAQGDLFEVVGSQPVFLGAEEGRDLDPVDGWRLAEAIGMDRPTFERRFDGTPGSLLVDADEPPPVAEKVPAGRGEGIAIHDASADEMPAGVPTNLPVVTSTFVGRERELEAVSGLLRARSLVTVTGPRGVGKTRLAVRVARGQATEFPDGVWYVDLSTTRYEPQVADILARSVGAGRRAFHGLDDVLSERLRSQRALVIVNGCDHVRGAAARIVARLTEGSPSLRVLITADERLGLDWEIVFPLERLSTDAEAERLFLDRSGLDRSAPGDGAGARSDAEPIYKGLAGNAAALEIAAAQVRASGVENTLAARRQVNAPRSADALRLAILSTLEDMSDAEASLFLRLSVMPDWFTLAAARAVGEGAPVRGGDVASLLRALVDRSLVLIDARVKAGQRFRYLPSVRDCALEQLEAQEESDAAGARHAAYYLTLAKNANKRLNGRAAREWLARIETEQQHMRAALRWSLAHDRSTALQLGSALWMASLIRSNFTETRRWIDELVESVVDEFDRLSPADLGALSDLVVGGAYVAYHQADYPAAERQLNVLERLQSQPAAEPVHGADVALRGLIARRRCQFNEAERLLDAAAEISHAERDLPRLADRLNTIGNALRERCGDLDRAQRLQEQSLGISGRMGDVRGGAMAQCDLAYVLMDRGELDDARTLLDESLTTRTRIKDSQGIGQALNGLGRLEREVGATSRAIRHHKRALEMFDDMGDALRVAETLEGLALALAVQGRRDDVATHLARAEEVRKRHDAPRPPVLERALRKLCASDDKQAGTGRFERPANADHGGSETRQPGSRDAGDR